MYIAGGVLPQKSLEFQSTKMRFPVFLGLNWEQKSVFFNKKKYSFHSGFTATPSILTSNEQTSIFKIKYIAHKQILRKRTKKRGKIDWNTAFCASDVTKA